MILSRTHAITRGDGIRHSQFQATALAVLLPLLLARSSLLTVTGASTTMLGLPSWLGVLLVYGLIAMAIVGSLSRILRHATPWVWGTVWLVLCALVIGAVVATAPVGFRTDIAADVLVGLGWLLGASAIQDFGKSRRFLYLGAFVIMAAAGIQLARVSSGAMDTPGYSQYLAYLVLPSVLIFVDACFVRRPIVNSALAAMSAFMMLSTGARGPLVVAVLFVCGRFILHVRGDPKTVFFISALGGGTAWLAMSLRVDGLQVLQTVLERLGLSTRLATFLMDGNLLQDRARTSLIQYSFDIAAKHPFLGVGMANERLLLAKRMGATVSSEALGWYPHNIFLEMLAQYGLVAGTLLILFLVGLVYRAVYIAEDPDRSAFVLVFVGVGLLPLLFSASYVGWPPFWALIGLCLPSGKLSQPSSSRSLKELL